MEQITENATPIRQTTPVPAPKALTETDYMKSAYSRGGLGLTALYGILQGVGTIFLIIGGVIAAVVALLPQIKGAGMEDFSVSGILEMLQQSGAMGWVIGLYVIGMAVGMTVGLLVMRKIATRPTPIEKRSLSFGQFLTVALMAYGLWGIGIVLGNFPAFFGVQEPNSIDQLLEGLTWEALPMYLYTVIGAPLFEELACRKLLCDRLHPYGEGYAMAASGLLFGLIHGNSTQFFLAFLLGMLFAMVYLRTGKILYTMLLHGMINLTATLSEIVKLLGVHIDDAWTIVIIVLGAIGCVALFLNRRNPLLHPEKSTVPDANNAAWKNVGMLIMRIGGLVLLAVNDLTAMLLTLVTGMMNGEPGAILGLLRLISLALAFVVVLLLPRWTRRFEPTEEPEELNHGIEGTAVVS